jgi:hypothetical protein
MEDLMERHFDGHSLRALAEEHGVSHQTIATQLRDAKRSHVTDMAGSLMVATKLGEVLWLAVPTTSGADLAPWLRYLAWLIDELESLSFRVQVTVQEKQDGLVFGLTDSSRPEKESR